MQRTKPDVVLIGNSMVLTRFHPKLLSKLVKPIRSLIIAEYGSMSSRWYLFFKYSIIGSGHRPRRVVFFFRDRELTSPRFRTTGRHAPRIARAVPVDDPTLVIKVAPPLEDTMAHLAFRLRRLAPVQRTHDVAQERLDQWSLALSGWFSKETDPEARLASINSVFGMGELRNVPNEGATDEDGFPDLDFSGVNDSFLPDILGLAKEHGIALTFVRIRSRSVAEGEPDAPDVSAYLAKLEHYLKVHDATYFDMKSADWETPDMYGSTDHIKPRVRNAYTRAFVKHMAKVFE